MRKSQNHRDGQEKSVINPNQQTFYPQPQMQSQLQSHQRMGVPSTPNTQPFSQNAFNNKKQMTPVANQGFHIPVQNNPVIKSAHNINFTPNDSINSVHRGTPINPPFFSQQIQTPQTGRNIQTAQIKIVNPPSPSNYQFVNQSKSDKIVQSPEKKPQAMIPEQRLN